MVVLWVLLGVAVLALASAIWPRWIGVFIPPASRIPGAPARVIPSWPVQAVSLAVLVGIAAYTVSALWPDERQRDLVGSGAVVVLAIGFGIWALASIVSRRDRESYDRVALEDELADGSDEFDDSRIHRRPTTPGYRFEYGSLVVALITVIFAAASFVSLAGRDGQFDAEADPIPTETVDPVDEILRDYNVLHVPYEVLDAAPETGTVVSAHHYAVVDADAELPRVVWHQSEQPEGLSPADVLAGADLVLENVGFSCTPVAIVVVETETTVTIGIAVTEEPPVATPGPAPTLGPDGLPTPIATAAPTPTLSCVSTVVPKYHWFPVDLAAPLGDRDVLTFAGRSLREYSPPFDYGTLFDDDDEDDDG